MTTAAVAPKLAPSGSRTSIMISSRSDAGKNWFGTRVNPAADTTNASTVTAITVQRRRTHQATTPRNQR